MVWLAAFRRGWGTRLNEAGVDSKEIQSILRHADVSTTMAFYVLPDQKRARKGLKELEQVAKNKYGVKANHSHRSSVVRAPHS